MNIDRQIGIFDSLQLTMKAENRNAFRKIVLAEMEFNSEHPTTPDNFAKRILDKYLTIVDRKNSRGDTPEINRWVLGLKSSMQGRGGARSSRIPRPTRTGGGAKIIDPNPGLKAVNPSSTSPCQDGDCEGENQKQEANEQIARLLDDDQQLGAAESIKEIAIDPEGGFEVENVLPVPRPHLAAVDPENPEKLSNWKDVSIDTTVKIFERDPKGLIGLANHLEVNNFFSGNCEKMEEFCKEYDIDFENKDKKNPLKMAEMIFGWVVVDGKNILLKE